MQTSPRPETHEVSEHSLAALKPGYFRPVVISREGSTFYRVGYLDHIDRDSARRLALSAVPEGGMAQVYDHKGREHLLTDGKFINKK